MLEEWQGRVKPHDWHVLRGGSGPLVLFLHGAGASAGSFRGVMTHLSKDWQVLAPDLPGHGGTRLGTRRRSGLAEMAEDIAHLVDSFGMPLHAIVGHSAGAAIALAMTDLAAPRGHVLINAALAPFDGVAGWAFPGLARTLRDLPFATSFLAARLGTRTNIIRLLKANGTTPSEEMISRYLHLASNPKHLAGTLAMMGQWRLDQLLSYLSEIAVPVTLIAAKDDPTVPFSVSKQVLKEFRRATLKPIMGGHLVHEAHPEQVAKWIDTELRAWT